VRITSSSSAFRILIEPFLYCSALDPAVLATGFEQDGQAVQVAGQVASLTSSNNFINFCLTVPNLPITNGQQVKTGSCNPAPMGVIAATTNIPSSKFVSPVNGQDIAAANAPFTITMAIQNLETGNFVNAASNYYSAPQQVNGQGNIIGHTHFTVQAIPSFTSTKPLDASTFAFFKGVNQAATNGQLSEDVTAGLAAGFYRVCSINTDLVAVAQHGNMDDCVYVSSDVSIHLTYRLILLCSSVLVKALTTVVPSAVQQPIMQLVLVLTMLRVLIQPLPITVPAQNRPLLAVPQQQLPLRPQPLRLVKVQATAVPARTRPLLVVPQQLRPQPLRLVKVQATAGTRQEMGTREGKVVASVWGVNPGLGVTTD
jgi:hypothetical protein